MDNDQKKNYLFLGFAIPEEEMGKAFLKDTVPQIQTHQFNWNLIKGLEHFNELGFTYISARPVTDYPHYDVKKNKKNIWAVDLDDKKIEIIEIPFINHGVSKLITRLLSTLFYSFRYFNRKPNKAGVIVYSAHVPFMIAGFIISRFYHIDYISIWTDPPAMHLSEDSSFKSKLRNIELKLSQHQMSKTTKVIALTKYLADDFAPGKPYLVMEGIIDPKDTNCNPKREEDYSTESVKIAYTGSIEIKYGIENIVQGFLSLKNQHAVLEIYGRGDFEEELKKITRDNQNVVYKGFVPHHEILKVQREADFLINARSGTEEFVKYSFPSKTLEYMLSGTPLLTTLLPGMPMEYKDYVLVLENNTPEVIRRKLEEVIEYSYMTRNEIGLKARRFAESKNYINQARKIIDFINEGSSDGDKNAD